MGKTDEHVRGIVYLILTLSFNAEHLKHDTNSVAFLEDEFIKSLKNVLMVKKLFVLFRWNPFIDIYLREMLSSHEKYITHVMFACCMEEYIDSNIFERFLNVCCTTIAFSISTCNATGVNYCESNVDIIMAYYEKKLKKKFNKLGGFCQLVEYIRQHKYTTWEINNTCDGVFYDSSTSQVITYKNLNKNFRTETEKITVQRCINVCGSRETTIAKRLALEILCIDKIELPILPSPEDLEAKLREIQKEKSAKRQRTEKMAPNPNDFDVDLLGISIVNSGTEPKAEPNMNNALCEKIVEAVVRSNNSKSLSKESSDNIFYTEACEILLHLKDTIKSLIEILDEIDKE